VRRPAAILTALIIAATVATGAYSAGARQSDARSDRDQVRADRAQVASNLDALRASQSELTAALRTLEENLRVEQGRLADAEQAVRAAEEQIAAAERGIDETTGRLRKLRATMAQVAVEAYVRPPGSSMSAVLESESASDAAERQALQSLRTNRDADLSDEIRTAKAELQARRRAAAAARERAERKRAEVAERVEKVQVAETQQERLVSQVGDRIQGQLAKAAELQAKDRELSNRIYREQLALAARLAEQRAAAQRAAAAAYNDGGREDGPIGGGSVPTGANVPLCTVGGITVNCQIEGSLASMLSAARGAGVSLSGSGWRDPAAQIALRREHCGTSYYAIYQMSPSACRPPTARPGQSMHEVGLAIDFGNCSSRSTPCFQWLASNAGSYGFQNLPSEPWHWSVNGQ
jgi:peptidoglycan hydrolase CwlO-like protein